MIRPRLVIVGSDGFARQVAAWIREADAARPGGEFAGFLDVDGVPDVLGKSASATLGRLEDWRPREDELFVCGLRRPEDKERAMTPLKARGAAFASVIHPTVCLARTCRIGEGAVLFPHSTVNADVVVGDFVTLLYSGLGHDARVGDYTTVEYGCAVTGFAVLGRGVWLEPGAIVIPHREIGDGARVETGSVVVKNVKPGTVVGGNPARRRSAR